MKRTLYLSILLAGTLLVSSCSKEPPVAAFSMDKTTFKAEEKITFTNLSENADSYAWDFGDGKKSLDENPAHTYTSSGDFTIKLVATGRGGVDSTAQTISVHADLTGMWRKTLNFGGFGINGTMNLKQHEDNTLTGSYVYEDGQGTIVLSPTSKVTGNTVEIIWGEFGYKFQGNISTDGKTMAGQIMYDNTPAGTWSAKKL
jgi:PKD repeat protein